MSPNGAGEKNRIHNACAEWQIEVLHPTRRSARGALKWLFRTLMSLIIRLPGLSATLFLHIYKKSFLRVATTLRKEAFFRTINEIF